MRKKRGFKCLPGCSTCCGCHIYFDKSLVERNRDRFQVESMLEVTTPGRGVQVYTEDAYCVFLDRRTRRCSVYSERPYTCVTYGTLQPCPYVHPNGTRRSEEEIRRHKQAVERLCNYAAERMINHGTN